MDKKETYTASDAQLKELKAKASPHSGAASRGPDLEPCCCNEVALLDVRSMVHDRRSRYCHCSTLLAECFNK